MPTLHSTLAVIDLHRNIENIESSIRTRTEIKKAAKSGIVVKTFSGNSSLEIQSTCILLLKQLLARELVPYDAIFEKIIQNPHNILMVASLNDTIVSFICISPKSKNPYFHDFQTAVLELSATNNEYRSLCPNYALIWEAIVSLKQTGFQFFSLGLLTYTDCPDPDLERVAFFKKKWSIKEIPQEESVGYFKYLYLKFFKRYRFVKQVVYITQNVLRGYARSR